MTYIVKKDVDHYVNGYKKVSLKEGDKVELGDQLLQNGEVVYAPLTRAQAERMIKLDYFETQKEAKPAPKKSEDNDSRKKSRGGAPENKMRNPAEENK